MHNQLNRIAFIVLLVLAMGSLQSCYMSSALKTGRTLAPQETEIAVNLSTYGIVDQEDQNPVGFVYPEVAISTGISERADFQGKIGMFSFYGEGRYQFIGDKYSPIAGSVGIGLHAGGIPVLSEMVLNAGVHVPAYLSFHPSDQFALYASPRVTVNYFGVGLGQLETAGTLIQSAGIVGIEAGDRFKVRVEGGVHSMSPLLGDMVEEPVNIPMYQLSIGMSYRFGPTN